MSEVARVESDTLFSAITGIDVDSRGRVYVADWFAARVTVLDAEGRILRTLGRKGLGPGEFRGIRGVQVLSGDSVLVYDPGAARLSVFPPDAEKPSYTVNLGAALGGPKPFTLRRAAADGAYVALIRPQFTPDAATPRRDEIRVLNADGTPRGAALRNFPSQSFLRVNQRGGGYSVMPNPFGRQAFVAAGADDRIHVVWSDSLAVETVDVAGRRVGGFSIRHSPPRVTEVDVSDAVRQLPPRMAAIFRPVLADSVPERWPAVRGLVADDQGRLWLGLFASSAEPAEWAAFDAGGHYEGSVFLPSDVEVMAVRGGKLYGVAPTEAGAPQVVVLRLAAQSAGGGD
ncbi:hypothetical protein [Longimicrobium sp.]|uniref:hypothetical protein n=1 Tax=Longimicrobium sp. TaxID=2029185 RepID=UPI002ED9FB4A